MSGLSRRDCEEQEEDRDPDRGGGRERHQRGRVPGLVPHPGRGTEQPEVGSPAGSVYCGDDAAGAMLMVSTLDVVVPGRLLGGAAIRLTRSLPAPEGR